MDNDERSQPQVKQEGKKQEVENLPIEFLPVENLPLNKDIDGENKEKRSTKEKNFIPPTIEEVYSYCEERHNNVNPQLFIDYYTAKGWRIGRDKMKDWRAAIRTWENNQRREFYE